MAEKFYHVLGAVGVEQDVRMLLADLSLKELHKQFVSPYRRGKTFFAGALLVAPSELRAVKIVETEMLEAQARHRINQIDLEEIKEMNRTSDLIIISPGRGYEPEDLVEAGTDVTREFLRGGPGSSFGLLGPSKKAIGWILGIVAAVVATGAAKWLGWA